MKTNRLCLCFCAALFLTPLPRGAFAQSEPSGKLADQHSKGHRSDTGSHSPILKGVLSDTLAFHEIILREEAALLQSRLRKQPRDPKLLLRTGIVLMNSSGYGVRDEQAWLEAGRLLLQCVQQDRKNLTAWHKLGSWYLNEFKFREARQCLEQLKVLGARADDVEVFSRNLENAEQKHRHEIKDAVPLRKVVKPDSRPLHEVRPIDEGDLSKETKLLVQRLEGNPTDAKSWHELSKALAREESVPSASMKVAVYRCLLNAKQHDPNNVEAREMLAEIYEKNAVFELMKEECRQLLKFDPNHIKARRMLENGADR